jgi:hypothetical protein
MAEKKKMTASLIKLPMGVALFGLQQVRKTSDSMEDAVTNSLDDTKDLLDDMVSAVEGKLVDEESKKAFDRTTKTAQHIEDKLGEFDLGRLRPSRLAKNLQKGVDRVVKEVDRFVPGKKEEKEEEKEEAK